MAGNKNAKQGTTDSWVDLVGRKFRPGDVVAVAVINGRSPQMVLAQVLRINTTNPKGEPHRKHARTGRQVPKVFENRKWVGPELPDPYANPPTTWGRGAHRENRASIAQAAQERLRLQQDPANWDVTEETRMIDEWDYFPTVTVTAMPIVDGRGFSRSDNRRARWYWDKERQESGYTDPNPDAPKHRPVTYQFPGNIVRVGGPEDVERLLAESESRRFGDGE